MPLTSAACGVRTPTRASRATFRPTSTPSRTRRIPSGSTPSPAGPRSTATSARSPPSTASKPSCASARSLLDASWDDERQRWSITTTDLELTADLLIDATGPLTEPQIPDIEGLESFDGTIFHSARWDHGHDLTGERVAVVGTGASSIQFVPEIQPRAAHVTVFQRTPGWVIPRMDRATTALERTLLRRVPGVRRLQRFVQYLVRDGLHYRLIRRNRVFRTIVQGFARAHLRRRVPDPELRAKLMPDFEVACKRILISSDWYPALAQDNVDVVAAGVREVRGRTVIANDGSAHEVDTIIFGTGFEVLPPPIAQRIHGRVAAARSPTSGAVACATTARSRSPGFPTTSASPAPAAALATAA